jgi:N6-adenosine-specific RNA methylase IME4
MAEIAPERFEQLLELHRTEVLEQNNKVSVDLLRTSAEADGREKRRQLAQVLSDASADLPTGRLFPCAYIDPPWERKQGVTNRSYENHYPTMSWDEIIALMARVSKILLPDNWVFLWIPRAHLLALHPVEMEFADDDGRIITRTVKLPLAWAVARALGCDNYSTCYIWTKTDEDHPDDHGGGVLVFDQDEILLQFKRGRGLPKPATGEKFNSNHRERKREHSRKPDHYREMIRTMTGGVPVLELFARVDADHPLPPDWQAWGNQAQLDEPAAEAIVLPGAGTDAITELAPLPAPDPEIIDGALQCRLPLSDDEINLQAALIAIGDGLVVEGDIVRHLVGIGHVTATTTRLVITEEGRRWLDSLVDVSAELDLPLFLTAKECRP